MIGNGYCRSFPKCFFGGGGGQQDNSAMYYAQAQQAAAQEREAKAALDFQAQQAQQQHQWTLDAQTAADAKAATDKQNAITQFQNDLGTATGGARTYAQQQEANLGVSGGNDYGLMNNFNNLLQSTLSGIGSQQTGNAGALVNGQSLFDAANSATLGQQRNKLAQQYNSLFGSNYVNDTIGDDLLNSDEANVLSTQQATAKSALDRALARGTLNQTGYDYANQQLGTQAAAAQAKIKAAGQGVLDNYRQQLTDRLSGQKSSLSNWNYGDNTDLSGFQSQINSAVSKDKANASGDFQNAIAGQSYFDPTTLLSQAGTYQGTTGGTGSATTGASNAAGANTGFLSSNPLATKPVSNSGGLGNQGIV